jgi:hypothetical protein
VILDEWREAERNVELAATPDEMQLRRGKAQALREEYQQAFEAVERDDAPSSGQHGGRAF